MPSCDTRPPPPRTGLKSRRCFAAPLADCDGGPATREHWVSKAVLERIGPTFFVDGLPGGGDGRSVTPGSMAAKVLCSRHNNALSALDGEMMRFHKVILGAYEGQEVGSHLFDGEDIERWALKVLLGRLSSGLRLADGRTERGEEIPEMYLQILFGEREMPEGCGFFYLCDPIKGFSEPAKLVVALAQWPPGEPDEGKVYGAAIRLPGFQFLLSVTGRFEGGKVRLIRRPGGFQLGSPERGRVGMRWGGVMPTEGLILRMP